jgi:hypothetical protein
MPAKEIKDLRQSGKLEEALNMAKAELSADPNNIWAKRNISWVYYDYLKQNNSFENFETFMSLLNDIKKLELSEEEKLLFDNLSWQVGKMAFSLQKSAPLNLKKIIQLYETIKPFHLPKQSAGYSFLFKSLHKSLKETDHYIQFSDWWDFKNFLPEDFQKEKMPNGKEVMSIAEQGYITYAKKLLPKQTQYGDVAFNRELALQYLPILTEIEEKYPHFQYPAYYIAKLLLALGNKENMLESLLPFAKKKRNDFWVWETLSEAFIDDKEKVFACYCKALSCKSPEEMLVNLRQKMAGLLLNKQLYNEAKCEIELLTKARIEKTYKIPNEVIQWQSQEWYKSAECPPSNMHIYKEYLPIAESILFTDTPEETVLVEFVNTDKKILNFIASETKFGFFKYERFLREIKIGDTLKVRFQGGSKGGLHQIYTAVKQSDDQIKKNFMKDVSGKVKIPAGKNFGFLEDVFIHPSIITKYKLENGTEFAGIGLKSYNQDKKQWNWKLI